MLLSPLFNHESPCPEAEALSITVADTQAGSRAQHC